MTIETRLFCHEVPRLLLGMSDHCLSVAFSQKGQGLVCWQSRGSSPFNLEENIIQDPSPLTFLPHVLS